MVPPGTLTAVMLVTVAVGTAAAILAWRERPEPGATPLAAMLAGQVWWSTFFVFELRAPTLAEKTLYSNVQWVGVVLIPVAWLLFALEYTGRDRYLRPGYVALLSVVPAVTVGFALAGDPYDLLYLDTTLVADGGAATLRRVGGPWFWIVTGYTYLLGLLGSIPLLGLVGSDALPFRGQSLALLVGTVAPWASNALFLAGAVPSGGIDPTPVLFAVSGVAYLGAITRFRLLGTSPSPNHRAGRLVFERMRDGAVVVDRHDRVVDMNERAAAVLDVEPSAVLGAPAEEVVPNFHRLPGEGQSSRHFSTGEGLNADRYDATVTAVSDVRGVALGRVIAFHDVSDHLRRQQRLEVLNRVLRHNIRTETNLIHGNADLIDAEGDRVEAVKGGAARIEEISDKARDVIDIFERGRRSDDGVALSAVLRECVDTLRERHPDVAVDCEADDGLGTVPSVLTPVFHNVVENAVEHNPAAEPRVWIRATRTDGEVRVRVADDGPGIADYERAVLERGNETALEHGSGLGLWLIAWGTDMTDGELTIADREGGGTVVTVTLPTEEAEAETADDRSDTSTDDDRGSTFSRFHG